MKYWNNFLLAVAGMIATLLPAEGMAQTATADTVKQEPAEKKKQWYENLSLRGYTQVRYNRFLETNPDLKCDQCDKSWGDNGGLFIRRARLVISGNVHDRVYVYIQPDFASSPASGVLNFGQLRDAYFDLALDSKKEFRLRVGQSKVPYGFENLQSSQNRLPLDRADPLNSALPNERDLGVFFYWAPEKIRERFSYLVSSGLKGSGDYGVFGFGVFNGQTANKPEQNDDPHYVARVSYPFELKNGQIIEPGIQAYTGKYVVTQDQFTKGTKGFREFGHDDQRAAATLVIYPQPLGFQAEYNIGRGPEFRKMNDSIAVRDLAGGYAMVMYMIKMGKQTLTPFVRTQYYDGGKKAETDARSYVMNEHEVGVEWQPFRAFELVAMYTMSDRRFEDMKNKDNRQKGNLLRLQLQFNY